MTMCHSSKPVLVTPRVDGLLVAVDGDVNLKRMTSYQYIQLAKKCLEAAVEMESKDAAVQIKERVGV